MKKLLLAAVTASVALAATAATPASASDGCGRGFHRGIHGHCRPNGGPARPGVVVGVPGASLVIDNFYNGRGYWDGHRYYQHRERFHGSWRYR